MLEGEAVYKVIRAKISRGGLCGEMIFAVQKTVTRVTASRSSSISSVRFCEPLFQPVSLQCQHTLSR